MSASLEPVHLPQPAVRVQAWSWPLVGGCTLCGALGALAAAMVRLGFRGLQFLLTGWSSDPPDAAGHLGLDRRLITPVLGALLATLVLLLQRWRGQGAATEDYIEYVEAVRHKSGRIPLQPNLWRTLSAACSVASGAAVGREGSMIQFAATLTSALGRWRALSGNVAVPFAFLVACGVVGGVTTAYNAPLASVCFAAEIVLGGFSMLEVPLLGLAAGAGWLVNAAVLGHARLYPTAVPLRAGKLLLLLPLLAVLLGLAGPVYQWCLRALGRARRLPLALLLGGAVVGSLSLTDVRVWGNGDVALRSVLHVPLQTGPLAEAGLLGRLLLLRLVANLACVWTGTVGGVFTPTLFAGAALGALLGQAVPPVAGDPVWAVAGMSLLLAAVTHAPVMAALMAVELTGAWDLLPLLLPLNYLATGLARRLSPQAMYAIASQSPESRPVPPSPGQTR